MFNPLPLIARHARRTRLRWTLGVLGLAIAVGLLTIANVGLDSFARNYLDVLTVGVGRADAHVTANPRLGRIPWYDGAALADRLTRLPAVAAASPRVQWPARVERTDRDGKPLAVGALGRGRRPWRGVTLIGLDLAREREAPGRAFGTFLDGSRPAAEAVELTDVSLGPDDCLISATLARRLKLEQPGGRIRVQLEAVSRELTVRHIVVQRGVFAGGAERAFVVVGRPVCAELLRQLVDAGLALVLAAPEAALRSDRARGLLRALYASFGAEVGYDPEALAREGTTLAAFHRQNGARLRSAWEARKAAFDFTTNVVVAFAERDRIYDASDIEGTVRRLRAVGERVQTELGAEHSVTIPRALALLAFESQSSLFRGIFWLFGVLALSISALLIYSLMSLNVEERVRESAILRTLGAYRRQIFALVLTETLLMATLALAVGVAGGVLVLQAAVAWFNRTLAADGWQVAFTPVVSVGSIAMSVGAGLVVGLLAGIVPARQATAPTIVDALRPGRRAGGGRPPRAGRGLDLRMTAVGAALFGLGLVVYYTITLVAIRQDLSLLAWGATALLLMMLVGFVLLALGLQPLLERVLVWLLRPYLGATAVFTQRNLIRYRRRNTTTALMFALSVALVMFLAAIASTVAELGATTVRYQTGADLEVRAEGEDPGTFVAQIEAIPGVVAASRTSTSRHFGDRLRRVPIDVRIADLLGLRSVRIRLYGTDGGLLEAIDTTHLAMAEGQRGAAFARVAASDPDTAADGAALISQAIASRLDVGLGARVRLRCRIGDREQERVVRVAGVVRRLPGLGAFRVSAAFAEGAGVLVSQAEFARLMFADTTRFGADAVTSWRSQTHVRTEGDARAIEDAIRDRHAADPDVRVRVRSLAERLERLASFRAGSELFLTGVLLFASVIAVFSLVASMYATVLERTREIAVLKALGMRPGRLRRMFAGEAITLLLASGLVGAGVGYVLAFLLVSVQELASEIPTPFSVPVLPTVGLLVLSLVVGVVSAWLPLRRVAKRPVAELLGRAG